MILDRISTEPFDTATAALLGRITLAETSGHWFHRQGDELRTYRDTTFDVKKIACSPGTAGNICSLTSRSKLPVGYAKLKCAATLPGEPDRDAPQPQKIYGLREFLGDGIGRALATLLLLSAPRARPLIWLDVLWQNERAIGFDTPFVFIAIADRTYTIGVQRYIFYAMARPLP